MVKIANLIQLENEFIQSMDKSYAEIEMFSFL